MRKMTEGNIYGHLLSTAVPLIMGNILQLTYNAVDSIIVSKGVGVDGLGAVSVSEPVSTIIILSISGIGIGASVLMGRYFGAGDNEKVKRALSTTIIFGTMASLAVLLLGVLFSGQILEMLNVPKDILASATAYTRIIFIGCIFTFQYNIMSNALRAVGDAKTPVIFVGIASVLNALMDVLFIFGFRWGVVGAGIATALAEGISAILCYIYVYRHIPVLQIRRKELVLDTKMLRIILKSGLVTALQQACQPIGKLLIQSVINLQGVYVISAFNAACRIEDFARIPGQSVGHSIMTCTAQNLGAGNMERTKESLWKGIIIGFVYCPIITFLVFVCREPLMKLFAPAKGGEQMIAIGVSYLSIKAFMFILPYWTNAIQGYFRGMGQMTMTLICTVIQISVRTIMVFLLVPNIGIRGEAWGSALGWIIMSVFEYGYYFTVQQRKVYRKS